VEEDTFEGLGVLTAALGGVAGVLEDTVATHTGPGSAASRGPAGCGDDVFDQGVSIVEVAGSAGSFPEAAKAGEEDALVVGVDTLVALVAFSGADVGRGTPSGNVEAVDIETFGICTHRQRR